MWTGVQKGGSEGAPCVCRAETRSHPRSHGGTDLAEQTAHLSPPGIDATVPSTSGDNLWWLRATLLQAWGRWMMSRRPPRRHPGKALPSPPLPSLTPSHQAGLPKTHLCAGTKYTHDYDTSAHPLQCFPPSCRVGNFCRAVVYNKLFAKVCEPLRPSMLFIGLVPQMPSCFCYRLITAIE